MAWDSMDMWWMNKPERSNLPELAVGAFMQGRAQAQRRAEFEAELPLKVAESNARTAAQVAQMNIATRKADREVAEWERIDKEAPKFDAYSQEVATWMANPMSGLEVPKPVGLTGQFQADANRMMLQAATAKRAENIASLAGQVKLKEKEDALALVSGGYLDLKQAEDPQAVKLARMNRSTQEAQDMAAQMGVQNLPDTNVPTLPNGELNKVAWESQLKKFKPPIVVPEGMKATKMVAKDAQGRDITYEGPEAAKPSKTREEFIRDTAVTLAKDGIPADQAAAEAGRIYDASIGKQSATPANPISVTKDTIQEQWDKMPGGTQFTASEDITLPDGGKIKKGTTVTKKTDAQVKGEKTDKLTERRNELRSDIRVGSKQGPFDEVVTPDQLLEEQRTMPDRTAASTFRAPVGGNAVRTRQRTPEDDVRLKKLTTELSSVLAELEALKK